MAQDEKAKQIQSVFGQVSFNFETFSSIYKKIHENPELGEHEGDTAALVVDQLKGLGFEVKSDIGGHGVVGIHCNGDGPTILLRADMVCQSLLMSHCYFFVSKSGVC